MKQLLHIAARTLVETALAHPHAEYGDLCDAALRSLIACGCTSTELRRLPAMVSRECRTHGVRVALLRTPSGESGEHRKALTEALENALGASIELSEEKQVSFIGGATLRIGDDILDRSVRGALGRLQHELATP